MKITTNTNPFVGLRHFNKSEQHLFFGRKKQVKNILTTLSNSGFTAIIGSSGSGKSSLIRSGLIPSIEKGDLIGDGKVWKTGILNPGYDPIGNLTECLFNEGIIDCDSEVTEISKFKEHVSDILRTSKNGINDVLTNFSTDKSANILLIIDQFEEVFKFNKNEDIDSNTTRDSSLFINLLLATLNSKKIYTIFSMRSDFIENCTSFSGLPEALNSGQYIIPKMTDDELREVIIEPIKLINAKISDSLVELLLGEISNKHGQLPILQHGLMRVIDFWQNESNSKGVIDVEHYNAIGGLDKALSNHVNEAYHELNSPKDKLIAELIFKSLADVDSNSKGVRRPCKLSDLAYQLSVSENKIIEIINVFRTPEKSFLIPLIPHDIVGEDLIDISHESLMREWDRLKFWSREERQSSTIYLQLCDSAALHQEGKGSLLTNPELEVTLLWSERAEPNEKWAMRYDKSFVRAMNFLDQSKRNYEFLILQKENTKKSQIKRTKIFSIFISFAFVVSIFLYFKASNSKNKAIIAENNAKSSEKNAIISKQKAVDERVNANFEAEKARNSARIALEALLVAKKSDSSATVAKDIAIKEKKKAFQSAASEKIAAFKAIKSQRRAKKSEIKAKKERENAIDSEKESEKLKNIAESIKEAFLSFRDLDAEKYKSGIDLALSAHKKFSQNSTKKRNTSIYLALNRALVEGKDDRYYEHKYGIKSVVINSKFNKIAIIDAKGDILLNTDDKLRSFRPSDELNLQQNVSCLNFSKDGEYLLIGTKNGTLKVLKPTAKKGIYNTLKFKNEILSVHSSTINGINYMLVLEGNNCHLIRRTKGEINIESSIKIPVHNFKINYVHPDFSKIIISNESEAIIYSLAIEAQKIAVLEVNRIENSNKISTIEMSSNGKYLALGMNNGFINLVTLDKNMNSKSSKTIDLHRSKVSDIKFIINNEESLLISSSYDNTIKMVNILDTSDHISLNGHNRWVQQIGLSSDNRRIISVSEDKTLRNWFIYTNDIVKLLNKN